MSMEKTNKPNSIDFGINELYSDGFEIFDPINKINLKLLHELKKTYPKSFERTTEISDSLIDSLNKMVMYKDTLNFAKYIEKDYITFSYHLFSNEDEFFFFIKQFELYNISIAVYYQDEIPQPDSEIEAMFALNGCHKFCLIQSESNHDADFIIPEYTFALHVANGNIRTLELNSLRYTEIISITDPINKSSEFDLPFIMQIPHICKTFIANHVKLYSFIGSANIIDIQDTDIIDEIKLPNECNYLNVSNCNKNIFNITIEPRFIAEKSYSIIATNSSIIGELHLSYGKCKKLDISNTRYLTKIHGYMPKILIGKNSMLNGTLDLTSCPFNKTYINISGSHVSNIIGKMTYMILNNIELNGIVHIPENVNQYSVEGNRSITGFTGFAKEMNFTNTGLNGNIVLNDSCNVFRCKQKAIHDDTNMSIESIKFNPNKTIVLVDSHVDLIYKKSINLKTLCCPILWIIFIIYAIFNHITS